MSTLSAISPTAAGTKPLPPGSTEYRELLARFFIDSHVNYDPQTIAWPPLAGDALGRLTRLPFWQEAVSTENMTSGTVAAAAVLEPDAALSRAIELQGFEEQRHARLLQALTAHYHITVTQPPAYQPRDLEHDFLFAGFGECFDSFFAFGLFAIARSSGYFVSELVDVFEPVIQEEARHILFFVNWVRHRRVSLPWWRRPFFRLRCGWIILQQVASRVRTARSLSAGGDSAHGDGTAGNGENFTLNAHQELGEQITLHRLLQLCLQENERRLGRYDARLARPRLVPGIAKFLHRVLPSKL